MKWNPMLAEIQAQSNMYVGEKTAVLSGPPDLDLLPRGSGSTFHMAVMPQFVCRRAGCGAAFATDPGALDEFLDHTARRRRGEAAAGLAPRRRCPMLPDTASLGLPPGPFFRPPNRHDEVPQRLSNVQAPPEDLDCRTLEDCVLKLCWIFRKLFRKRVEQALIRGTEAAAKKRHRTSTPIMEVTNPEKRANSNPGRSQGTEDTVREPDPYQSPGFIYSL